MHSLLVPISGIFWVLPTSSFGVPLAGLLSCLLLRAIKNAITAKPKEPTPTQILTLSLIFAPEVISDDEELGVATLAVALIVIVDTKALDVDVIDNSEGLTLVVEVADTDTNIVDVVEVIKLVIVSVVEDVTTLAAVMKPTNEHNVTEPIQVDASAGIVSWPFAQYD